MAEVLITLGIIGVVAALTIPTLMQKIDERDTVAKVKKMVNLIENASKMAFAEKGKFTGSTSKEYYDYLSPYMKISKYCGTSTGCWDDKYLTFLHGNSPGGNNINSSNIYEKAVLSDGTSIQFYAREDALEVKFDINGFKGPHTLGIDIFGVNLDRDNNSLKLTRGNDDHEDEFPNNETVIYQCDKKQSISYNGYRCINWIMYNDNMDYLHCDDLSWDSKTKCD